MQLLYSVYNDTDLKICLIREKFEHNAELENALHPLCCAENIFYIMECTEFI